MKNTKLFANEIRKQLIKSIHAKGGGHIGGCLSITDVVAVLYDKQLRYDPKNPKWEQRDYLVCSKGHSAPAIYCALALKGFFPLEWLDTLNKPGTRLPGHSDRTKVPGIDATTGSLGQGLSIACGIAHSLKCSKAKQYVYCITGDGENDEGQVWEAALYAANFELDNLIMFLDRNKKQIDGSTEKVMKLGDLTSKYAEFGWYVQEINGNDVSEINQAIENVKAGKGKGKPAFILLDTIKGAGIKTIENLENNHCIAVPDDMAEECLFELEEIERKILFEE